ncbi:MAG: nucleotidyltransferase domain-containing protein [Oscillibacter sp.]|jgi:predicted nucleotidyltransferase|nr:nucleotidyltransferase domain-containing protein [Oscillibacter sp.]
MIEEKVLTTAKEYAATVRKTMDAHDVFLYGSHAKGRAKKDSAVDTTVVADQVPGGYLDTMASLWRLTNNVDENMEAILLLISGDESGS